MFREEEKDEINDQEKAVRGGGEDKRANGRNDRVI